VVSLLRLWQLHLFASNFNSSRSTPKPGKREAAQLYGCGVVWIES
jgi:hypothetical protein